MEVLLLSNPLVADHQRREVIDRDDVIVWPQHLKESLEIQPFMSRSLNGPAKQVEPINVDAGAFFRVGH